VALASAGRIEPALRELEAAIEPHPYDRDLLTVLATYQRDRGDVDAATAYAERLVELFPEETSLTILRADARADQKTSHGTKRALVGFLCRWR
jgi:predicted Zn-dependent protease